MEAEQNPQNTFLFCAPQLKNPGGDQNITHKKNIHLKKYI
jgi:hypothetical protein